MPRSPLIAFCALLCTMLAFAPGSTAKAAPAICTVASSEAVGGSITGKLTSSNVDPAQAGFATCRWAKKVMARTARLGVGLPRPVRSFFCRPHVNPYYVNIVYYICSFRGADTATFIKLTFEVEYKG
jgi:hypothetical protein